MKHLADVSEGQGAINHRVLASRLDGVYVRRCDGTFLDKTGAANWAGLKGLTARGAYAAWYAHVNWNLQVRALVDALKGDRGELPPVLDVESPEIKWSDTWRTSLVAALRLLEQLDGRKPLVYTGNWYITGYAGLIPELENYGLWLGAGPVIPKPWTKHVIYQYDQAKGSDYGASSDLIDLDEASDEDFQMLLGGSPVMGKISVTINGQVVTGDDPLTLVISAGGLPPPPPPGNDNWHAMFFGGVGLAGPVIAQKDFGGPALDVNMLKVDPAIPQVNFSAALMMTHLFDAGAWQWTVNSDDGFRLYVDGVIVPGLDGWIEQSASDPPNPYHGHVQLSAGLHTIRVEYSQLAGLASLKVSAPAPF